jgi:DNA-binding MarR family transcriptional regulator
MEAVSHPRHLLDDLLGHPVRFSIMALLAPADRAEFGFVRDQIEVNDSVLSKQISALKDAGFVKVHKSYIDDRARTSLALTGKGRSTFKRHLKALREIAEGDGGHSTDATLVKIRP